MPAASNPAHPPLSADALAHAVALAHTTFDIEAAAILGLKAQLGAAFGQAVQLLLATRGRVVVMGMGKSGHIGRKIAATLASTGTPALFVHPAEASHGDLGMVTAHDAVLMISNSGESDEINAIVPVLKRLGTPLIAMCSSGQSSMAQYARIWLNTGVAKEACPLNLAPTASTTAQLAMGDALALALLEARLQALGITQARYGIDDKLPAAQSILDSLGLEWNQTCAMGDDWPDWPMMHLAALSCAPSNAHAEIRARAHWLSQAQGGHGAVREICDLLLMANGHYGDLMRHYAL